MHHPVGLCAVMALRAQLCQASTDEGQTKGLPLV